MHQLIDKKNKIILYLIFLFILSTTSGKFIEEQKNHFTTIDKIDVNGLSSDENLKILNELNNFFHQNIFFIQKEDISNIISKHNIIEEYNIKKIYPSKLSINIKPTKFIAKFSGSNKLLVGANGKFINIDKIDKTLPYIFGAFNTNDFLDFKKNIELSKFNFKDFETIFFFPSKRWDIVTIDNILIKLPQDNLLQSLNLAYRITKNSHFKDKKIIDLRVTNHLIVK